jgi:hypothetical protein
MNTQPFDWLDPTDHQKMAWACDYLTRKKATDTALAMQWPSVHRGNPHALIASLRTLPNDAATRELSRQMRSAWQTHQYRKREGKPVTFVLSHETLDQLKQLVKASGDKQVGVVRQLIADAYHAHQRAAAQVKKEKKTYQQQLKHQQTTYQQKEQAYRRLVAMLDTALAEEIDKRCQLKATLGDPDDAPMTDTQRSAYHTALSARLSDFTPLLKEAALMRFKLPALSAQQQAVERRDGPQSAS